jgi:hypothetical protein
MRVSFKRRTTVGDAAIGFKRGAHARERAAHAASALGMTGMTEDAEFFWNLMKQKFLYLIDQGLLPA